MRLLALALFALCTAGVAASKVSTSCSTKSCCNAQDAFRRCPVGVLGEGTTSYRLYATGVAALLGGYQNLAAKKAAMCAAVEEVPVGVRPPALEKACSGAKTTDIKLLGDLGEGTLLTPTTDAPTTDAPTTFAPTTLTPTTDAPTTDAPITLAPTTLALVEINEAKCAGTGQNNDLVEGSLDCTLNPSSYDGENPDSNKGSACIDNLSSGKAFLYNSDDRGECVTFNSNRSIFYVTQFSDEQDTVSKMVLAHPNRANEDIGVFAMKRMLCEGSSCSVFKVGYCVKCPGNVFESDMQKRATPEELGKFFDCCVMGKSNYTNTKDGTDDNECPSGWTAGAFTSPDGSPSNDPLATIHADYSCDGDDAEKAMMLMKVM